MKRTVKINKEITVNTFKYFLLVFLNIHNVVSNTLGVKVIKIASHPKVSSTGSVGIPGTIQTKLNKTSS